MPVMSTTTTVCVVAGSTAVGVYVLYKLLDTLRRLPHISRYSDRYILVTGWCDSGFGLALVQRLDSLGCHVFAGCLTDDGVKQLVELCSDRVLPIHMDVTKPDSVRHALQVVTGKLTEDGKGIDTKCGSFTSVFCSCWSCFTSLYFYK